MTSLRSLYGNIIIKSGRLEILRKLFSVVIALVSTIVILTFLAFRVTSIYKWQEYRPVWAQVI